MNPIPAYYGLLHKGTNGPDVALVQTWLNSIRDTCSWFEPLKVDGHFGPHMEKAVMEFQLRHRLNADGKVGKATWEALHTKYSLKYGTRTPYPGILLRQGSAGSCVRMVQQSLNAQGERLNADGRFGAKTAEAVRRFQSRTKLSADGIVGKATWDALYPET